MDAEATILSTNSGELLERARIAVGSGDVQTALSFLEDALDERSTWLAWIDVDPTIDSYFKRHLQMSVNGKSAVYRFENCEINDDSIWLTFSMACTKEWNDFSINPNYS